MSTEDFREMLDRMEERRERYPMEKLRKDHLKLLIDPPLREDTPDAPIPNTTPKEPT